MNDVNTGQRITNVERPKGSPPADLYRCHLCWESDNLLLIGWANTVTIVQIKVPHFSFAFSALLRLRDFFSSK